MTQKPPNQKTRKSKPLRGKISTKCSDQLAAGSRDIFHPKNQHGFAHQTTRLSQVAVSGQALGQEERPRSRQGGSKNKEETGLQPSTLYGLRKERQLTYYAWHLTLGAEASNTWQNHRGVKGTHKCAPGLPTSSRSLPELQTTVFMSGILDGLVNKNLGIPGIRPGD